MLIVFKWLLFHLNLLQTKTTATLQHTGCDEMNRGFVRPRSQRKDAATPGKPSASEWLCLGPQRGTLFTKVRKRRDILELYSTTIKQLQGPQLRSSMPLSPHRSLLPPFIRLSRGTPQPHVRAHNPLWISSHTSELQLHAKQLGSSWNTTSRWNDNDNKSVRWTVQMRSNWRVQTR